MEMPPSERHHVLQRKLPWTHAVPMPSPPSVTLAIGRCLARRPQPRRGSTSGYNCPLAAITAVLASVFTFAKVKDPGT